jgi:CubicO group peptidase (beta-lactamase class C family)
MRTTLAVRLAALALVVASASVTHGQPALRPGEVATGEQAQRVDAYLSKLVPYGLSGAVLIAKDGQIVLKRAYGMANRETKLPYDVNMVSCIGSVTKQFTGAAIMKLEMMGKLNTADLMSQYLPGVPADKAGITIHQLLTHTSGISGDLGGMDEEPITRDALVAKVLAAPLASKPGTQFEYSNENFSLAAAIIEIVSKQNYETFLREQLWLPAGMKDTGYQAPNWPLERLPIGYRPNGQPWGRTYKNGWLPDGPGWYLRGNGGIQSTLDDLYRWHLALEKPGVLSADALKKYLTGYAPTPIGEKYAYGWGVQTTRRGTTVIAHNGGNGFLFTDFRRYVDEKVVIIAMTNEPNVPAPQLAPRQIESLFFGGGPDVVMPPTAAPVSPADRDRVAGTYALDDGTSLTLTPNGSGLSAVSSNLTLLGGIPGLVAPGGRSAALEAKSMTILDAASKDNFRPLFDAFSDERPFEVVQGNQRRFWAGWRSQFGEFRRLELLGTAPVQGDPAVTVRAEFARGSQVLQLIWGPRRLAGFMAPEAGAPVTLTPEFATTWSYYAYTAPSVIRIAFDADNVTVTKGAVVVKGKRRR